MMSYPGILRALEYEGHFLLYLQLLLLFFSRLLSVSATQQQIRYLDDENGHDSLECLNSTAVACKTLYYALGQQSLTNLELRVRPGEYNYTNGTELRLKNPEILTLRVDPANQGEVIFRCRSYTDDTKDYNNMAIIGGSKVRIEGITVKDCGPYAAGIYVKSVQDIIISNCTFKLVENS